MISESGTGTVIDANEGKILSSITIGEAPFRSSIVAAHGQLLIRTAENLYCIKK
jgi:hypothetical protein